MTAAWTKQAVVEVGAGGQTRMYCRIRRTGPANETDVDGGREALSDIHKGPFSAGRAPALTLQETTAEWGCGEGRPPQDGNGRTGLGSRLSGPVEAGLVLVRPSVNMKTPDPSSQGWRRGHHPCQRSGPRVQDLQLTLCVSLGKSVEGLNPR